LLDEPAANLDPAARELVEPLLGRGSGRTRVIVSHDPAGALAESDVALGLVRGRAAFLADARAVVAALLRKELRVELRTFESVPAMSLFSITVYVLFHFGLQRDALDGALA